MGYVQRVYWESRNGLLHLKSIHPLWKILEKCSTGDMWIFKCNYLLCDFQIRFITKGVNKIIFRSAKWAYLLQIYTPPVQYSSDKCAFLYDMVFKRSRNLKFCDGKYMQNVKLVTILYIFKVSTLETYNWYSPPSKKTIKYTFLTICQIFIKW